MMVSSSTVLQLSFMQKLVPETRWTMIWAAVAILPIQACLNPLMTTGIVTQALYKILPSVVSVISIFISKIVTIVTIFAKIITAYINHFLK